MDEELAWMAGLLEGEGTLTITGQWVVSITIANTERELLEPFKERFGGAIYSTQSPAMVYGCLRYQITGKLAKELVQVLLPFMRSQRKRRLAELLIEFPMMGSGYWATSKVVAQKKAILEQVRTLNRKPRGIRLEEGKR